MNLPKTTATSSTYSSVNIPGAYSHADYNFDRDEGVADMRAHHSVSYHKNSGFNGRQTDGIEVLADDEKCAITYSMQDLFDEVLTHADDDKQLLSEIADDDDLLVWALDRLSFSQTAFTFMRLASVDGWDIGVSHLDNGGFHLDVPEKRLVIDHYGLTAKSLVHSIHYRNAFLVSVVQGLRDLWQEVRFGAMERNYKPDAVLMLERLRAADMDTMVVLTAWELRSNGEPSLWRHLLACEYGDMAILMSNMLDSDTDRTVENDVLARVFRQWFADDMRINAVDHETLETLDMVLGWASEGEDITNPFGNQPLDAKKIEALSLLPDSTSYLENKGEIICSDPVFYTINDVINEAHLFQIVYDMEVFCVEHVPFRDRDLARKIFPDGDIKIN